jgi:pSer/pThr/pTyr-binding forkhead associated (FHA) protein
LVSQGSGEPPKLYEFKEPERIVLGRGPESPVPLDGPSISRDHLAFEVREGRVFITDLSSNGSYLNGQRLSRGDAQRILEEDEVGVPGYSITFRLLAEQAQQPGSGKEETVEQKPPPAAPPPPQPLPSPATPASPPTPPSQVVEAGVPAAPQPRLPRLSAIEWTVLILVVAAAGLVALYVLN